MKQKKLLVLALLSTSFYGLQAQYLSIDTNAPATTSHQISGISTLTFSGGNLVVTPTTGPVTNYAMSSITGGTSKLYFTATNLNNEQFAKESSNFTLYPNPVKDVLHLQVKTMGETMESIEIWNVLGARVQTATIGEAINVSSLTAGVYFCKLKTAKTEETIKFVKE
jgi:hypothetical protein